MVIGADSREPGEQLFGAFAAATLSDGRVVIANAGTSEIKVFDSDGSLLDVLGSRGQGPGEFEGLGGLRVTPEDTIVAWHAGAQARARFSPHGELVDHMVFREGLPALQNHFEPTSGDRAFFLVPDRGWQPSGRTSRPNQWLVRFDGSEGRADSLDVWPAAPRRLVDIGGSSLVLTAPFAPRSHMALGGDPERLVVGDAVEPSVRVYDLDGREFLRIRWEEEPRFPSRAEREERIESLVEGYAGPERVLGEDAYRGFAPAALPFFDALHVDRLGRVWVRRFDLPSDSMATWNVFAASGTWLGRVALPKEHELLEASHEHVLVRTRGELDIELIGWFDLLR
jgi:hypothetical protein